MQNMGISNYKSYRPEASFVWLDADLTHIEQRFQLAIYPNQWKYFSNIDQCQKYILNEQIQSNLKIYLILPYALAEQLVSYEHTEKIYAIYFCSHRNLPIRRSIQNYSNVRGIYRDSDKLFEQFNTDLTAGIDDTSLISNKFVEIVCEHALDYD